MKRRSILIVTPDGKPPAPGTRGALVQQYHEAKGDEVRIEGPEPMRGFSREPIEGWVDEFAAVENAEWVKNMLNGDWPR